ncbi:lipopolysaccharide biosynthesis protein [Aliiglaciecola litoralis]|uniref:Oligosaccharide flippase family protein n=1 Tax=Aliiglaciecola litoralis TaxID=582857 RepID=A0ABP3WWJ7_9ALTE
MSEVKTILDHGKIYLIANITHRAAGLLLLPIYTHVLSTQEYGLYAIVMAVTDLFTVIFGMGFSGAMSRFYFDSNNSIADQNKVVSTTLIGFFGIAALIIICAYPMAMITVNIMFDSQQHLALFVFAIAGLVFTILFELLMGYAVIRKRAWKYFAMALSKALLFIGLNLYFVVYLELGVPGIIYATIASLGSLGIVLLVLTLSRVGVTFSFPLFKQMVLFGLPLVPSAFANSALTTVERYYINLLVGPAAVGVYSLGHRLASMLHMFIAAPFSQIFFVRRFETLSKGEDQSAFHRILLLFVALMMTCAVLLSLFGTEIIWLIAPEDYYDVVIVLPLLGLSFVLSSLNLNIELGIFYNKKTWAIPIIGFVTLGVGIPANYVFISQFGIMGAGLALVAVNIVRISTTVLVNSVLGSPLIRIDWKRAIAIMALGTILGLVVNQLIQQQIAFQWIALKLGLAGLFILLLLKTHLLDKHTRQDLFRLQP